MKDTERRVDPFTGRSVVVAPSRRGIGASRPGGLPTLDAPCPFCPGHEAETEASVSQWPPEGPWRVRVVHNKFPLVSDAWMADGTPTRGVHEIGVDTPEHDADLADLSVEQASGMWRTYRDRVAALEASDGIRAVLLFRNRGRRAGSSQPHPHTQLVALEWVPFETRLRWDMASAYLRDRGEPLHLAELRRELEGPRLLSAGDRVVTFARLRRAAPTSSASPRARRVEASRPRPTTTSPRSRVSSPRPRPACDPRPRSPITTSCCANRRSARTERPRPGTSSSCPAPAATPASSSRRTR